MNNTVPVATVNKIIPGSVVKCASVQNIGIDVLGEGRSLTLQHIRFMAGVASELTAISGMIAEHQSDTMPF